MCFYVLIVFILIMNPNLYGEWSPFFNPPNISDGGQNWNTMDLFGQDLSLLSRSYTLDSLSNQYRAIQGTLDQINLLPPNKKMSVQVSTIQELRLFLASVEYGRSREFQRLSASEQANIQSLESQARSQLLSLLSMMESSSAPQPQKNLWKVYELVMQLKINPAGTYASAMQMWRQKLSKTSAGPILQDALQGAALVLQGQTPSRTLLNSNLVRAAILYETSRRKKGPGEDQNIVNLLRLLQEYPKSPLYARVIAQLIQRPSVTPLLLKTLAQSRQNTLALFLAEKQALTQARQGRLADAAQSYEMILREMSVSKNQADRVRQRILQFRLKARQWDQALAIYTSLVSETSLSSKLGSETEQLLQAFWQGRQNPAAASSFLKVYSLAVSRKVPLRQEAQWRLNAVEILMGQKRHREALDLVLPLTQNPGPYQEKARQIALDLMRLLLALSDKPQYAAIPSLKNRIGNDPLLGRYRNELAKRKKNIDDEHMWLWVSIIVENNSSKLWPSAQQILQKSPQHPLSGDVLSWFLKLAIDSQNWSSCLRIAKLGMSLNIQPSLPAHRPLSQWVVRAYWEQAEAASRAGKYAEAAKLFKTIVKEFPQDPKAPSALHRAAEEELKIPDYGVGVKTFIELVEKYGSTYSQLRRVLKQLVEAAESSGQYAIAYRYVIMWDDKTPIQDPQKRVIAETRIRLGLITDRIGEVVSFLNIMKKRTSSPQELQNLLMRIYELQIRHGDSSQKTAISREVLRYVMDPNMRVRIMGKLSVVYLEDGDFMNGEAFYRQAQALNLNHEYLAAAEYLLGKHKMSKLSEYQVDVKLHLLAKVKKEYQDAEALLLKPCDRLPNRYCGVGLLHASMMAEALSKSIYQLEISSQLDVSETKRLQKEVSSQGQWFEERAKTHARNAAQKLSYGVPSNADFYMILEHEEKWRGAISPVVTP